MLCFVDLGVVLHGWATLAGCPPGEHARCSSHLSRADQPRAFYCGEEWYHSALNLGQWSWSPRDVSFLAIPWCDHWTPLDVHGSRFADDWSLSNGVHRYRWSNTVTESSNILSTTEAPIRQSNTLSTRSKLVSTVSRKFIVSQSSVLTCAPCPLDVIHPRWPPTALSNPASHQSTMQQTVDYILHVQELPDDRPALLSSLPSIERERTKESPDRLRAFNQHFVRLPQVPSSLLRLRSWPIAEATREIPTSNTSSAIIDCSSTNGQKCAVQLLSKFHLVSFCAPSKRWRPSTHSVCSLWSTLSLSSTSPTSDDLLQL